MTYKETLFFVGQSLTINHEEKNKIVIEAQLKKNTTDWDAVVKVSTGHFVFPALYCNLKRANFLHYLPEDLVQYMQYITDLNRERNHKIMAQAKEINELLLANNITPIFLKGTGNLLEGLYEDVAERMVGDIDFIVSRKEYLSTITVLTNNNKYKVLTESSKMRKFHWHYPRLVHPDKICAVEIHNKILKKPFDAIFNEKEIEQKAIKKSGYNFLSSSHKLLNAILPKIINDNLYYSQGISLRTMYDVVLITKEEDYTINLESKTVFKKFNNFLSCIKLVLNNPKTIKVEETKKTKKYQKSYLLKLKNSKKVKLKLKIIDKLIKFKNKITILKMSFYDKEYRTYTMKRIFQIDLYKNLLGFKTTN